MSRLLVLLLVGVAFTICRAAEATDGAAESFESAQPGPLEKLDTPLGVWTAAAGHAEIHNQHAHDGRQSLRLLGGQDRTVELAPRVSADRRWQLTFWAERWTRNQPFSFRIDRWDNGWRTIYEGDERIRVGGFHTHVAVDLGESPPARLRMVCSSPKGTGLLVDSVALAPAQPMSVGQVSTVQPTLPALVGRDYSRVALVRIETSGNLSPVVLSEIAIETAGTSSLDDIESIGILPVAAAVGDSATFGDWQAPTESLVFAGRAELRSGTNDFWVCMRLKPSANIDHLIAASCSSIRLANADAKIVAAAAPQSGGQRLGVALRQAGDDDSRCYRIPGLAATNKGTLIAVYDVRWRGCGDLPGDIDVGMHRSTDGGRTWEPMKIILDMGNDPNWRYDGVGDPAVLVDRNTGTIWVAGVWNHGNQGWHGSGPGLQPEETAQLMLVKSDDDGVTWSQPINITKQIKKPEWCLLLQGPGKGVTMRDGTLVFAAQYQDSVEAERLPYSTIIYSKDHGTTWQIGSGAFPDTTEAQVVEIEPGVLMLNCRYNRGSSRVVMTTKDMGKTWTEHATSRKALAEPATCMASLIDVDQETGQDLGGWLLFSNPAVDRPPRRRMTIKASPNRGAGWPDRHHLLLDEGNSAGYSCLTMIDDETVGILYESSQALLAFQRISLQDIISPPSRDQSLFDEGTSSK